MAAAEFAGASELLHVTADRDDGDLQLLGEIADSRSPPGPHDGQNALAARVGRLSHTLPMFV
jgi:hypothetical protein